MRILHAAHMRQPAIGVIRQMEYEQLSAIELNLKWDSKIFCPASTKGKVVINCNSKGWLQFKTRYYKWLANQVRGYDLLLLRYSMYDPLQAYFLANCPIPVVTMHHTLEIEELRSNDNLRSDLLAFAEKIIGPMALRHVDGVAGVTWEISKSARNRTTRSNTPALHYSNGAVYSDNSAVAFSPKQPELHELLMVSSKFSSWMGLDLLIDAARKCKKNFKVHLVGGLTKQQIKDVEQDPRFLVHGYLDSTRIDELVAQCSVGLSTFAIYRKNFTEGNTLKVREYLRAGLPVYAGYQDVFDESFKFYRNGPADFDSILAFAEDMRGIDRLTISATARPLIEKKLMLNRIYDDLTALFQ